MGSSYTDKRRQRADKEGRLKRHKWAGGANVGSPPSWQLSNTSVAITEITNTTSGNQVRKVFQILDSLEKIYKSSVLSGSIYLLLLTHWLLLA